jgi:hypothetical protein
VFDYKTDTDGYLTKFKARLCARGDLQESIYEDTYAATLAARAFRSMVAIIAVFGLYTWQGDAVNAFAHTLIDEVIYIKFPDGFEIAGMCILLRRALYGLRRSPLLWYQDFTKTLRAFGLKQVAEEPCLYHDESLVVFFYVDDITAACSDPVRLQEFKEMIRSKYEIKDLGELTWFLGIRIIRDEPQKKLWLCQDAYIEKIANSFNLKEFPRVYTPMTTDVMLPSQGEASKQQVYAYQRKVGSLLYATSITRPDVARTASKPPEFLLNPSRQHEAAVN